MKKAASIFLRADIQHNDLALLIRWLENPGITRYMNEDPTAARQLRQLSASVPAPMLRFHLNRQGRFFLICREDDRPIGFVKLTPLSGSGRYEIVYAVGEESLWDRGYGESAIRKALSMAFLEWRAQDITARIYAENQRSIRSVRSCGFRPRDTAGPLHRYTITSEDYLDGLRSQKRA